MGLGVCNDNSRNPGGHFDSFICFEYLSKYMISRKKVEKNNALFWIQRFARW